MTQTLEGLAAVAATCLARHRDALGGGGVLAAVSGGNDSLALALALARLAAAGALPGRLVLGHVDHRAHERSAEGASFVRAFAGRLAVPFCSATLPALAGRSEAALRDARYAALVELARGEGCTAVATAHHGDDDLETVLFRLMRGTGLRGLSGVPELRPLAPGIVVVRPLLQARRARLEAVVREAGLAPFEDPTNADPRFARNRIRHVVLPELRAQLGVSLDASLFALQRAARAACATIDEVATAWLRARAVQPAPWRLDLRTDGIEGDDVAAFVERLLALAWARVAPDGREPKPALVARMAQCLRADAGARVQGRGNLPLVERTRTGLLFVDTARAGAPPAGPVSLRTDGEEQRFGTTEWLVRAGRGAGAGPRGTRLPAAAGRWSLRTRRPGETLHPLGAPAPVELAHWLQSHHVPRFDRDRLPLVVDRDDELVAVPGLVVTERARLTSAPSIQVQLLAGGPGDDVMTGARPRCNA
jgi:tRNA(Ile)-lysidine synthase